MVLKLIKIYYTQKKNAWRGNREKLWVTVTLGLMFFLLPLLLAIIFLEESLPSFLANGLIKSADIINSYVLFSALLIIAKNLIFGMDFEFESKFKNIATLPIRRFTLFTTEIIISFINILNLFLTLFFLYLIHFLPAINTFHAMLLYLMYIVIVYLLLYLVTGIFSFMVSKISAGFNFNISYLLVIILLILIAGKNHLTQESIQKSIFYINGLLPAIPFSNFFTNILNNLQHTGYAILILSYSIILFLIALLLFGLYRQYLVINFKDALYSDINVMKNQRKGKLFGIVEFLKLSPRFSALLIKEIKYLFRSIRMRSFTLIALLTEYLYLKQFHFTEPYGFLTILILILAPTVMAAEALAVWEYDGKGGSSYFEIPLKFRDVIKAKNVSFLLYVLFIQLLAFLVDFYFRPQHMTLTNIILSLLATILFYTINAHLTNYLVVEHPNKVSYNSLFSRSGKTIVNIYNMASIIGFYFLLFLLMLLPPVISFIVLIILITVSLFIYYKTLNFYAERFIESRDYLIKELS